MDKKSTWSPTWRIMVKISWSPKILHQAHLQEVGLTQIPGDHDFFNILFHHDRLQEKFWTRPDLTPPIVRKGELNVHHRMCLKNNKEIPIDCNMQLVIGCTWKHSEFFTDWLCPRMSPDSDSWWIKGNMNCWCFCLSSSFKPGWLMSQKFTRLARLLCFLLRELQYCKIRTPLIGLS